jgi:SPP1 family predicted phage head-tail adaptor
MISEKNSLCFMNVCSLVSITVTENDYGETTTSETSTDIFCAELPITSNEFRNAQQGGFKAQRCVVVNSDEYNEENLVEYEGKPYSVYRYYPRADNYTELYCCTRLGNG